MKTNLFKTLAVLAVYTSIVTPVCSAATLIQYPFTGGSRVSTAVQPNTTVSNAVSGNASVLVSASSSNLYYEFSSQQNKQGAIDLAYYVAFTLTPDAGYGASYSQLSFAYGGTGWNVSASYNANFFVRSSLDGYTSDLASFAYTVVGTPTNQTPQTYNLDLSSLGSFQGASEPLTFRIYSYTDNFSAAFNSLGRPRVDNIVLQGEVAAVPEPATVALLSLGIAAIAVRKRFRRTA